MSKPTVFISSRHRDAELAGRFERALEKLGFQAFNPARGLRAAEDWRKAIKAAIKQSDALIVLALAPEFLSPEFLGSSWMAYEAGIAEALGKPVIVLLPNRHSVAELPADITPTQIVNFDPEAPERAAHEIAARLAVA